MPDNSPALVVVAAGGLGTRVHLWSRFIPKEFYPVDGRPGITHLLEEIAALGPARVVIVYHPYYEQFTAWARQVLSHGDHARYSADAGVGVPAAVPPGMSVTLIPQHGPYDDLTSVLNGASQLGTVRAGCTSRSQTTSTRMPARCPACATPAPATSPCSPAGPAPPHAPRGRRLRPACDGARAGRAQLDCGAQHVPPAMEPADELLIGRHEHEEPDQLSTADFGEPPQLRELIRREHVPGRHRRTFPRRSNPDGEHLADIDAHAQRNRPIWPASIAVTWP